MFCMHTKRQDFKQPGIQQSKKCKKRYSQKNATKAMVICYLSARVRI